MLNSPKWLLQESQGKLDHNRLITLINSLNDAFLAVDETGKIGLSNSLALNLLDSNSLDGKNLGQVLKIQDMSGAPVDLLAQAKKSGNNFTSRDLQLKTGDSLVYIYCSVSHVRGAYGKKSQDGFVIILRDISKEKLREDERDEFISVTSHELRTPVAIAEGSVSNASLLAERNHSPDTIIHSLKSAHQQLIFLGSLINDLAILSRADGASNAINIENVDLLQLSQELIHDYQAQATKKGLGLTASVTPDIKPIFSSKLYIREILQNLITNAIKYTEKGSVQLKIVPIDNGAIISVTDTGIGIDQHEQSKLFTKFFRSEDYRVRQINGTGLGLYISAKLARLIGSSISVRSEINQGSVFTLNLPSSAYHHTKQKN
jgi:two-component system phosphate regulon sensor histidine kinase PhoR